MMGPLTRCMQYKATGNSGYAIGFVLAIWSLLVIFFLTRSFVDLPQRLQLSQRCRMSRMWPSYVPYVIPSPSGLDKKYRLFLYREATPGRSSDADQPRGRPALFVPGNAGSFGQVRSVASSAHHLFYSGQAVAGANEVDWWTVDFNEDFSAFHGQTMQEQALYLNEVIAFLLHQYPSSRKVPIVGHSMGGIVARLMLLKANHPKDSVDTIITLSSPHTYPPVPLDRGVEEVYDSINSRWREDANDTLLISLSGGILDNQLSSEPASLSLGRIWFQETSLNAFTSSLAGLWSGVDHLAMMWCDQLRERIARGVLDIEGRDRPIHRRREEWKRMLGIVDKRRQEDDDLFEILSTNAHEMSQESPEDNDSIIAYKVSEAGDHQKVLDLFTSYSVGLDTSFGPPIDQEAQIRVELCTSDQRCRYVLPSTYDLYPPSAPDDDFPRAEERYEMPGKAIRRLSLTIEALRTADIDRIRIEKKQKADASGFIVSDWSQTPRLLHITPHFWGPTFIPLRDDQTTAVPNIETIVSGIDNSLFAYNLYIAGPSAAPGCKSEGEPMLKIQSMATGDTQYYPAIRHGSRRTFTLHSTSPYMPPAAKDLSATSFSLLLDSCAMIEGISLQINWRASAGLLVSRYRSALVAFPLAIIMLANGLAWDDYNKDGDFPSLTSILTRRSTLLMPLLLSISIVLSTLQKATLNFYWSDYLPARIQNLSLGIPASPFLYTSTLNILFITTTYGLALIVSLIVDLMLTCATLISRVLLQTHDRTQGKQSKDIFSRPRGTIVSAALLTILVWLAVPVQFVFLVLFLIQFLSSNQALIRLPKHNLQQQHHQSHANQQKMLLNVYLWLLPFNAPALLIWSRNLLRGYFGLLAGHDHNILAVSGFLLITQISNSGQVIHRSKSRITSLITLILFALAFVSGVAYGIRYTYLLFSRANLVFLWLGTHHYYIHYRYSSQEDETKYHSTRKESDEVEEAIDTQVAAFSNLPSTAAVNSMPLPGSLQASLKGTKGYSILDHNGKRNDQEDIDALLERYLDLLDDYFAYKEQIAECFAQGAFHLSKAKMQLGRVTSFNDAWDARMKASLVVEILPDAKSIQLKRKRQTEWYQEADQSGIDKENEVLMEVKDEKSILRNRKAQAKELNSGVQAEGEEKKKKEGDVIRKKSAQPYDPLYQFSALPPPSLRKSQSRYREVLELLVGSTGKPGLHQIEREMRTTEMTIAKRKERTSLQD